MMQANTKTPAVRSGISECSAQEQFERTAEANPDVLEIICEKFKPFQKNSLKGFADLILPAVGLRLVECGYFEGDSGSLWVGFPSRCYEKGGEKKWARMVDSVDKQSYGRFQRSAVAAIQKFLTASAAVASADKQRVPF
jgi:hypothetical protein